MDVKKINPVLLEDLERTERSNLPFNQLRNSTVLITGATGLVGSMLVKTLLYLNAQHNLNLTVLALVRNIDKADEVFAEFLPNDDLRYITADLIKNELNVEEDVDYIIHAASVTTSKIMVEQPAETILTAIRGTEKILNLAKEKRVESFVYISSMEVYGAFAESADLITEDKLGYVDTLKVRSNYPESKRMCENLCIAYMSEYDVPVKVARLAQTFGVGILPTENRVFAQFARSAIEGKDIVLHTKGLSEGNYSYLAETIQAILLLLIEGENGEAYNIANETCHTTIADMAKMVADEIAGGKIKVVFDIPENNVFGYAADTHMKLSSEKIRKLGWEPKVGLIEAYRRMIRYMESVS